MNTLARLVKPSIVMAASFFLVADPAAAFLLQDDNDSYWGTDSLTTRSINGNVVTYKNIVATNNTDKSLPSISFAVPFVWAINGLLGDSFVPLQWRNDLSGWYTSTYHDLVLPIIGPTTSLTVRMTSNFPIDTTVPMGEIADLTGSQQLPLTQPCTGSPSCYNTTYPPETRNVNDLVPRILLGVFGPHEKKYFDLSFNFTYGDPYYTSALPIEPVGFTVSEVPLPAAVWLFSSALVGLGVFRKRHRAPQSTS